mmetsp:Transcript_15935/g.30851  ORF Transcript_15935/g.30851 Transcript_15935/m.30851 type:complete len:127 (+) Transcript_15935:88-468(+)
MFAIRTAQAGLRRAHLERSLLRRSLAADAKAQVRSEGVVEQQTTAAASRTAAGAAEAGKAPTKNRSGTSISDVLIFLIVSGGCTAYLVNEVKDMAPLPPKGAKKKPAPTPEQIQEAIKETEQVVDE